MGQGSSSSSSWPGLGAGIGGKSNFCQSGDLSLTLPDECLAWVFGKLGCHDRNNCSLVCKRWRHVDSKARQRLVLVAGSDISPWLPSLFSRFSSISVLSLKCSRKLVSIDDDSLAHIPTLLPSLKKLKLKGCVDITDNGLRAFSMHRPPLLTKLSFASCGVGSRGIVSLLLNCPSLKDLTLKRLRKLDAQNTPLTLQDQEEEEHQQSYFNNKFNANSCYSRNKLERLCLKDLHNARLFIPLLCSTAQTLKTLIVCRSSGNWDPVLLESLQTPSSIVEIQVENVQMGDPGLLAISTSCPHLQVLYLSRATDCTDDGLSAIANSCRKLRKLHIDAWCRFGSRAIGEAGFLSIAAKCPRLQEVVLMGVPITVSSLNVLASSCPVLERMALCNTDSVGDMEMQFIGAKFTALKKLCVKNCAISDSGVKAVGEGCPNLVKLKVKRCRGVTQATVSKLKIKRRCLMVSVDSGSMLLDGHELDLEEEGMIPSALPNTNTTGSASSRTHVVCSSRGALLLRSTFENALLQLHRRRRSNSSVHNLHVRI
ncbi:F-box protein SKIP2-like [Herrania umbratica]|uniref:F-box protein SKIP2-like n=1 Tax=Herrania umbratica TaxID=108875 RepID=A0A6J0ZPA6_9ROSI|nr:F-box protein SKIP2-like [Herrania umbratica]